jgi:hypothetical protein
MPRVEEDGMEPNGGVKPEELDDRPLYDLVMGPLLGQLISHEIKQHPDAPTEV